MEGDSSDAAAAMAGVGCLSFLSRWKLLGDGSGGTRSCSLEMGIGPLIEFEEAVLCAWLCTSEVGLECMTVSCAVG